MSEIKKLKSHEHPELDVLDQFDSFEEMQEKLDEFSHYIGRIIIEFNALESTIEYLIALHLTHAGDQDDRTYIFFTEMMYSGKARVLVNLYGQLIGIDPVKFTQEDLLEVQKRLDEASRIRNEYAHANWQDINRKGYVCVKTTANRKGLHQKYRLFDVEKMIEDLQFIIETAAIVYQFDEDIYDQFYGRA